MGARVALSLLQWRGWVWVKRSDEAKRGSGQHKASDEGQGNHCCGEKTEVAEQPHRRKGDHGESSDVRCSTANKGETTCTTYADESLVMGFPVFPTFPIPFSHVDTVVDTDTKRDGGNGYGNNVEAKNQPHTSGRRATPQPVGLERA